MNALRLGYDSLFSHDRQASLERLIVNLSAIGFVVHLVMVFLARSLAHPPTLVAAVGKNYLAAIYTPFSFILFYEVLMLIAALPHSTTQSIAKQYEIVSLIFIRRFFKDIAELDDIGKLAQWSPDAMPVFLDVGAGLLMFLLVTVFLHIGRRREVREAVSQEPLELKKFIARKQVIAVLLAILLVSLAAYNLGRFGLDIWREVYQGTKTTLDLNTFYYTDVFSVMIFTDVLIVILSLAVSDRYEWVFRNAAFVISTILIRFSLTVAQPFASVLAISGMVFGSLTLLIFNYHTKVREAH